MTDFYQNPPEVSEVLHNTYLSDPIFVKWVQKKFEGPNLTKIQKILERCGEKSANSWLHFSQQAEKQEPELVSFTPWGKRIDEIQLSSGWKELEKEAAREGVVATAYERTYGELSRPLQMALLYLFHSSSAFVSCPLAMTDGAARCLELLGNSDLKNRAFKNLTSRDPEKFWTSGQWMTERTGGSDVSGTSTIAKKVGEGYELYGTKWFTSATTSQMALMLAKIEGTQGLSLFYAELRDEKGNLNKIEVHRLKDKMGTRAMPTAELSMKGTPGILIGEIGQGVKNISTLLNVTRVYNSVCSVSHIRRGLDLLQSYSLKRTAFGKKIAELPLHARTLQDLEHRFQKNFAFTFRIASLLGKEETGKISPEEKIELRALTPVLKLFTAKEAVQITSEVCEGFGGAGYIEDTGLPKLLRDAQVFSIWEGTTNVLSLDFLRALSKEPGAHDWLQKHAQMLLQISGDHNVVAEQEKFKWALSQLAKGPEFAQAAARDLTLSFASLYSLQLLQTGSF